MRRNALPLRLLLLGRDGVLPVVVAPAAPRCSPGGAIHFSASAGSGTGGVMIAPAAPSASPGGSISFKAGN